MPTRSLVDLVVLQLWIPEVRNFTHLGDFQHIDFKYKTFLIIGNVLAEVSSIFLEVGHTCWGF